MTTNTPAILLTRLYDNRKAGDYEAMLSVTERRGC